MKPAQYASTLPKLEALIYMGLDGLGMLGMLNVVIERNTK
jgi:hypothetical protein